VWPRELVSWEGPDPVRDEDESRLCAICSLGFHTGDEYATADCGCLKHGCGCRVKREQLKEVA
jgi:hypothetical protein